VNATETLDAARVDLVGLIERGIPEREYVPGTNRIFPAAKRLHVAAEKKTGKSLALGVVLALRIVKEGGSVSVLDRENGEDEYARRLASVMEAWNATSTFREQVRSNFRYFGFPQMALHWNVDATYPAAFEQDDVVIFDSSRSHLTPLGLKENSSDDYTEFT